MLPSCRYRNPPEVRIDSVREHAYASRGREGLDVTRDAPADSGVGSVPSVGIEEVSGEPSEQARSRHDRMKRNDEGCAVLRRGASSGDGRGGDDAHMTMSDVGSFIDQSSSDILRTSRRPDKAERRRPRGVDAPHSDSVHQVVARRRCYDDDVVPGTAQPMSEILKVQLKPTAPRREPVADEGDLHITPARAFARRTRTLPARARSAPGYARRTSTRECDRRSPARREGRSDG